MRTVFHAQLSAIDAELVDMTQRVGSAMNRATQSLLTPDLSMAESVIAADSDIDELAARIEEEALALVAQQQPVAQDLRALLAALRISGSLERMGDLAVHVAKAARMRYPIPAVPLELRSVIVDMGSVAQRMVEQTGVAIAHRDVVTAAQLHAIDRDMDHLHREMFGIALSPAWTHGVEAAIDVTLISRYYERFADHAVTIGKRVIHVVTGEPYLGNRLHTTRG
ncbi:MAG: phosphate signaling complex protein PhoU [Candidatus Nanopelagicales bacterium]